VRFIDSVDEPDSLNEIRDVLVSSQFSPTPGGTLSQLEHHCQRSLRGSAASRFSLPQPDCGERTFDRIGRANVAPVLRRKIKERQQNITVFSQARHALFVLGFEGLLEQIERLAGLNFCWSAPDSPGALRDVDRP